MKAQNDLEDYRRDGVIHYRSLLSPDELSEVREAIRRYQIDVVPNLSAADFTLEPDRMTVRNLWRMEKNDPFFLEFAAREKILNIVSPLVNGEPVLVGVETFNKPAQVGSAVPPHQDNAYFCQSPPDVLTVWIAIDPATAENGAVEYLLGSHHEVFPHTPSGVKGNSIGLADPSVNERFESFLGTVEPGDALIHHSQTVHFSQPNRSDQSRLCLILVYRGSHTRTDPQLQDRYHRALAQTPQNA
ncbi:phytanoyl-CoA dioxygenase family protein [Planctomicrobium sp. SH661]|uniref:phytanoyl-CoA dioxygenase family protein n=1 Tax=Planctomicrobium sp. SH661 TaxID=3448124 RepID=UPI003F5B3FF7